MPEDLEIKEEILKYFSSGEEDKEVKPTYTLITENLFYELKPYMESKGPRYFKKGTTTYFDCKYLTETKCMCKFKISLKSTETMTSTTYFIKGKHNHLPVAKLHENDHLYKQNLQINEIIRKELENKTIENSIIIKACKEFCSTISEKRIRSKICRIKHEMYPKDSEITISQLKELCDNQKTSDIYMETKLEDNNLFICAVFKENLSFLNKNYSFCADTTFNLFTDDSKLIICGFTDMQRVFHPLGLLITRSENIESYSLLFGILKAQYQQMFKSEVNVSCVISDAGKAVISALSTFNTPLRQCMFHIKKRMLEIIKPSAARDELVRYYDFLSWVNNKTIFENCIEMLNEFAIKNLSEKGYEYVKRTLIDSNNWSTSFLAFTPTTNNALEAVNMHVKKHLHTKTKKAITFAIGIPRLFEYLTELSKKRVNSKVFYKPKDKMLKKDIESTVVYNSDLKKHFCLFKHIDEPKSFEFLLKQFLSGEFIDIESAMKLYKKCVFTEYPREITKIEDVVCSCYDFNKNFVCAHAYTVLVDKKKEFLFDTTFKLTSNATNGRKTNNYGVYRKN